jgi:hypothetical protein
MIPFGCCHIPVIFVAAFAIRFHACHMLRLDARSRVITIPRSELHQLRPKAPGRLLPALARKHRLHMCEAPSIVGSDTHGFIVSKQPLDTRDLLDLAAVELLS